MVKKIDCKIVVSEFEFQSRYYVHFRTNILGKGMNPPYPPSYGLNSTTIVLLEKWLWHWITYKIWYAIKQRNHPKPETTYFSARQLKINFLHEQPRGRLHPTVCHRVKRSKLYFLSLPQKNSWLFSHHNTSVKSTASANPMPCHFLPHCRWLNQRKKTFTISSSVIRIAKTVSLPSENKSFSKMFFYMSHYRRW